MGVIGGGCGRNWRRRKSLGVELECNERGELKNKLEKRGRRGLE